MERGAWGGERGAGSGEQGAGSREQGAGSREQGAGSREQGAGSREQGAGSREQGAGSREQGAGSREQGAGSREQGAGSREQGRVRSTKHNYELIQHTSNISGNIATERRFTMPCAKERPASATRRRQEALLPQVCKLALAGQSCRQIAATCGLPKSTVNRWLEALREDCPTRVPGSAERGEKAACRNGGRRIWRTTGNGPARKRHGPKWDRP